MIEVALNVSIKHIQSFKMMKFCGMPETTYWFASLGVMLYFISGIFIQITFSDIFEKKQIDKIEAMKKASPDNQV